MIGIFFLAGLVAFGGCAEVSGERITAKDFAKAVPEFAALPENLSLGFAPLPGARRAFAGSDVQRIAAQYGVKTGYASELCFEWPMKRLDRAEVLQALQTALGSKEVQLEEFSLFPAPPGELVFPIGSLNGSFWRGYVQYGGSKRFNIWAKVKVSPSVTVATRMDVVSGAKVTVLVRSGAAELKFDGQAISSGAKGQMVTVRNPSSGRSFPAEVVGKDSVLVEAGGTQQQ